jgi:hypothetical protein
LGVPRLKFNETQLSEWCARLGIPWQRRVAGSLSLDAHTFFDAVGFSKCLCLDIADYEGADIIHDLNSWELPSGSLGTADCVLNAGTLEHVFHIPNALRAIHELLAVGGMAVHIAPANGYLDHGFYQLSPTLLFDYYRTNEYGVVSANLVNRYPRVRCEPYVEDVYRRRSPRCSSPFRRRPRARSIGFRCSPSTSRCIAGRSKLSKICIPSLLRNPSLPAVSFGMPSRRSSSGYEEARRT